MTKEEAQAIIDNIDSSTVIDSNWLYYLIDEPGLLKLQSLLIVTEKSWTELIHVYEGQEISVFQTEKHEIYVGKVIKVNFLEKINYYIITAQDKENCYYINLIGNISRIDLKDINDYLFE